MWSHTTYSDRIIILTRDQMRISFKSSDIMHVREYHIESGEFQGAIKTVIDSKFGDEVKSYEVDQGYDKIIKLLYPIGEIERDEAGIDS